MLRVCNYCHFHIFQHRNVKVCPKNDPEHVWSLCASVPAWHSEHTKSVWGVARIGLMALKRVRGIKIDPSNPGSWPLKKHERNVRKQENVDFVCKGYQNHTLLKCISFYAWWGLSQAALAALQESYWHYQNPKWLIPMNVSLFTTSGRFQDGEYATRIRREHQKWESGHSKCDRPKSTRIRPGSGGGQHRSSLGGMIVLFIH